jgi:hypothetical protein
MACSCESNSLRSLSPDNHNWALWINNYSLLLPAAFWRDHRRNISMEDAMTVYMVERDLKGISIESLSAAQKVAIAKAKEMTGDGTSISYIRSTFVPDDGRCMCMFEAGSAKAVQRLNDEAHIPYHRISEALDLRP